MSEGTIVITYPPDYDGELHIGFEALPRKFGGGVDYSFRFIHAAPNNESRWDTLVAAAKAIIAQDERRFKKAGG